MAMKPFEIKKKLTGVLNSFSKLTDKEKRTSEEEATMTSLRGEIKSLTDQLNDAVILENANKRVASADLSDKEKKEVKKYSFARAIKSYLDHGNNASGMDGLEGEMQKEAARELQIAGVSSPILKGIGVPLMVLENSAIRASTGQSAGVAGDGGSLIQEDTYMFIEALKDALVLTGLGSTFLTGLVGNLPLLKGGSFTSAWVAEGNNVSFTKEAFTKKTMSPKNLMCAGAISKQLLVQTDSVAEQLIRNELVSALAQGIQNAAINGSGTGAEPTGILNTAGIGSVTLGDNGGTLAWKNLVDLETAIYDKKVIGDIAYLTNPKVRGFLKTTLKNAGVSGFLWENNEINGCKANVTTAMPSTLTKGTGTGLSSLIAGAWSNLYIGMWGGMDIVVDPYTRSEYNELKLVFNEFADVALRNPEAFSAVKDIII